MRLVYVAMAALACVAGPSQLLGQDLSSGVGHGAYASREALRVQAEAAERAASDAAAPPGAREHHRVQGLRLRSRIRNGDFAAGDRIVLVVVGEAALTDTFAVRAGPALELPDLPPLLLNGVLRSELQQHLTRELGRFLRNPQVQAVSMLRVAVMGEVGRPGYYDVPADMLLSDVLMVAGGPVGTSDLKRARIRRGDDPVYSARSIQIALSGGMTLDALSLQSGDEFFIAPRRRTSWTAIIQATTIVTGVVALLANFIS
jgi:hypothetical protein